MEDFHEIYIGREPRRKRRSRGRLHFYNVSSWTRETFLCGYRERKLLRTTFPARREKQVSSSLRAENPAEFTTVEVCPFYFKNLDWIETRTVLIILSMASFRDTFHRVEIIQRSFVLLFLRLCFWHNYRCVFFLRMIMNTLFLPR